MSKEQTKTGKKSLIEEAREKFDPRKNDPLAYLLYRRERLVKSVDYHQYLAGKFLVNEAGEQKLQEVLDELAWVEAAIKNTSRVLGRESLIHPQQEAGVDY